MEISPNTAEAIADLADAGVSVADMQAQTGKSLGAVTNALIRWLRWTGRVDVSPWLMPECAAQIATALGRNPPPSMAQVAAELQVPMWAIRLVAAATWNAAHPVAELPDVPLGPDGAVDLPQMLAARWPMPHLVRATGLHASTLEARIAQCLAAQPEPDASPWLTEAEIAFVSELLDGPGAFHALRRAQARGETTRGKVAIVLALRGQWQADRKKPQPARAAHHGKAWSHAEDVVVRAGHRTGTPLDDLAAALQRSPEAVLHRALHLGLLATTEPRDWGAPG